MFDIGWTEVIVVIVVACLMLDIKDIASIIKLARQSFKQLNHFTQEVKSFLTDIEQETQVVTKKIIDLEGKEQVAYDIEQILPKIHGSKKNKNNENQ